MVVSRPGRLITGSASGSLRLWSVEGVSDMIKQTDQSRCRGLTMEDEMMLGGMVTTAAFDDTMDMVCMKRVEVMTSQPHTVLPASLCSAFVCLCPGDCGNFLRYPLVHQLGRAQQHEVGLRS